MYPGRILKSIFFRLQMFIYVVCLKKPLKSNFNLQLKNSNKFQNKLDCCLKRNENKNSIKSVIEFASRSTKNSRIILLVRL